MPITDDFYCPTCGYECVVVFDDNSSFETCECADCGGVMLKEEDSESS